MTTAADPLAAFLEAGASPDGIGLPTGYAEVDDLLRRHRREV